jgi:hypothetical protein
MELGNARASVMLRTHICINHAWLSMQDFVDALLVVRQLDIDGRSIAPCPQGERCFARQTPTSGYAAYQNQIESTRACIVRRADDEREG